MGEPSIAYKAELDADCYQLPTIETLLAIKTLRASYTQQERDYYMDVVAEIIATTDKGIHRICREGKSLDNRFPPATTILDWVSASKERSVQYARSKDRQMDLMVEDLVHIADTDHDPNRARVRIDARKWVASKLAPKKYGERLDVSHSGNLNLTALSDQELMRIAQEQNGPVLIEHGPVDK